MLQEWKNWWRNLSAWKRIYPVILFALYWAVLFKLGGLRDDIITPSLIVLILYYSGPKAQPLLQFLMPLFLTVFIYDSQRYYADLIRGPIHVKEPYDFDKYFFGINTEGGRLTPNEWWQLHTHAILDFFCGVAYIIFVPVYVAVALAFRFYYSRVGTSVRAAKSIELRSTQVMWAFFWVNMIGYSTYYWYAASPPWYVALHGFGPARLDVEANLAGCARFDELLGLPIFKNWYGRSADVHGAIPSLHIAYPLISLYYAFRFGALRTFTVFFYVLMCFSAVYLNHHYILDVIWGSAYALIVAFSLDMYQNHLFKKRHITVPGHFDRC